MSTLTSVHLKAIALASIACGTPMTGPIDPLAVQTQEDLCQAIWEILSDAAFALAMPYIPDDIPASQVPDFNGRGHDTIINVLSEKHAEHSRPDTVEDRALFDLYDLWTRASLGVAA